MSEAGENTDPDAIDEWRVDIAGPVESAPAAPAAGNDWSGSEAQARTTRVRQELETWRSELGERVRQLEERLSGSAG